MSIIKVENLCKSYGKGEKAVKAVDGLSFQVEKGELFAFLGVNGAGKSTTINILCGMLDKDGGKIQIDGVDTDENRVDSKNKTGVVFQNSVLDAPLSVYDNLVYRGSLYGMEKSFLQKRIKELASLLEFEDFLHRPVGKLSGGQRRKIDIARAIIHSPKILILDEPTTGLDPQTRKKLWEVIRELRQKENMTVFLTTHYMEEASEADNVVIIDKGRLAAVGTPLELKNKYTRDRITFYGVEEEQIQKMGYNCEKTGDGLSISVKNTEVATRLIIENPDIFKDYEITKGKMDDVFLAVTGKKLSGGDNNA
jgi:multidrug/hemolysin transport system ATP-binding protein